MSDEAHTPNQHGLAPDERARLMDVLRDSPPPRRIGNFAIVGELGRGGMGTVYEAEQDHPRRRVALKVIRPGLVARATLRRFKYEADVLARLAHPGVARVYEAGVADAGAGPQPYFAMELVQGRPLDEHVRDGNLSTRDRLKLLIAICDAVHHAHTKGVIHRDLKPSNILVTAEGQPKVLDFGVARATDRDVQGTTLHTEAGQLVGTLPYMAPEQASGKVDELDTSSDVYALGVIAYELLSGRLPYAVDGKPLHEAVRVICADEPSRLSVINKSLRGDVETIIGKALEKDRARRYHTAGELAADVKRYLDYEPISARPPGTWYQLARFARRNKALVGGVLTTLLVLLIGAGVSSYLAVVAFRQRAIAQDKQREAEAVVGFLTKDVLAAATPDRSRDAALADTMIRAILEPAAASVRGRFGDRPLVEASVRDALAYCYHALGRADLGMPHLQWALEQRLRLQGPDHPQTLISSHNLAAFLKEQGKAVEAERLWRDVLAARRRVLGAGHTDTLATMDVLADVLRARGAGDEAEALARAALAGRRAALGDDHADTISSMNTLAMTLRGRRDDEAAALWDEALGRARRALGEDHPFTIGLIQNQAGLAGDRGDHAAAAAALRDVVERRRRVQGTDHPWTLLAMNNLAARLHDAGKLDDAEALLRELPERYARAMGERHPQTLIAMSNLAAALQNRGKLAEAEPLLAEVCRRARDAQVPAHVRAAYAARYGLCLAKLARYELAEAPLREALGGLSGAGPQGHRLMRGVLEALAQICDHSNRFDQASQWRDELARWEASTRPSTTSVLR